MALAKVNIRFGVNMNEFTTKMQKATKKIDRLGKNMQRTGRKMSTYLTAPLAALGGVALKAFDTQIKAEQKLAAAVRVAGDNAEEALADYKAFASQIQEVTTVGDEATLANLALARSMGLTHEQSKAAAKQAVGLSAAFGINEQAAIRYTAALQQGDTTMLNRYIPTLRNIEDESQRVATAQQMLSDMFEQATVSASVGLGPLEQLKNEAGDLMEEFGAFVAQGLKPVVDFLKRMVSGLQAMSPEAKKTTVIVAGLVAAIGPLLVVLGTLGTLLPGLITAFTVMTGPIGLVVASIAALSAAFVYAYDNWDAIVERISDIGWWRNTIISMLQFWSNYNPFSVIIEGYNALLSKFGMSEVGNPFREMADELEGLKVETKEYEHEFGSFGDAVISAGRDAVDALGAIKQEAKSAGDAVGRATVGGGSGRRSVTMIDAPDARGVNFFQPQAGAVVDTSQWQELTDAANQYDEALKRQETTMQNMQQVAMGLGGAFQQAFETMITGGENAFQAVADYIAQLIGRLIAAALAAAVLSALIGGIGGSLGLGSQITDMFQFSNMFSQLSGFSVGQNANGGLLGGGMPSIVGERGPELFIPDTSGKIVSNDKSRRMLGGAAVVQVQGSFKFTGTEFQSGFKSTKQSYDRTLG